MTEFFVNTNNLENTYDMKNRNTKKVDFKPPPNFRRHSTRRILRQIPLKFRRFLFRLVSFSTESDYTDFDVYIVFWIFFTIHWREQYLFGKSYYKWKDLRNLKAPVLHAIRCVLLKKNILCSNMNIQLKYIVRLRRLAVNSVQNSLC